MDNCRSAPKVLIVDDEFIFTEIMCQFLENRGYTALLASNKKKAIEIAATETPKIIMTDLMLPDSYGLEVISSLKEMEHLQKVPVIIVSAYGDDVIKDTAVRIGVVEYLEKPVSFVALEKCLQKLLSIY